MKRLSIYLLMGLLLFAFVGPVEGKTSKYKKSNRDYDRYDSKTSIDIEDGSVIVEYDDRKTYDKIEITEDYELFINDDLIDCNADQTKLVKEFHTKVFKIKKYAVNIGWEGAKIGAEGAKLGLKAIGRVIKLISADYDSDDLERDMERDAKKIEKKADKLEKKAEIIERMVEDLDDLAYEMKEEIPELDELDWFWL